MTKRKVLLLALAMILLGIWQVIAARTAAPDRATAMRTASGMIAVMSGIGMGLFGLGMKEPK